MTIKFQGTVHEFSFDTAYFTVQPEELFYISMDEYAAKWWVENLGPIIEKELLKVGGGIIWWRVSPEIDHAKIGIDDDFKENPRAGEFYCWKGYARFATSPELPEEVITRLGISADEFRKTSRKLREQALATITV